MKSYRPITDRRCRRAICAALNKLFWKVQFYTDADHRRTTEAEAEAWVAILRDRDIRIRWDSKEERFVV